MAQKSKISHAERAAASAKAKSTSAKKNGTNKQPAAKEKEQIHIPVRLITSVVSLALFILFAVMIFDHDGGVLGFTYKVVLGLIGEVGFYASVPILLYMFIIHAFSGKRPVIMRSISLICLTLICGCLAHLNSDNGNLGSGFEMIRNLYSNSKGGVICGAVAELLNWAFHGIISNIILIICGILTLLASVNITIPSMIRAFENRPKADWEEDERHEVRPEPAAIVVNHIATKRIEHIENRRRKKAEAADIDIPLDGETNRKKKKKPQTDPKTDQIMAQIDDIDTPVAAADTPVSDDDDLWSGTAVVPEPPKKPEPQKKNAPVPPIVEDEPADFPPVPTVTEPVVPAVEPPPEKVTAKEARDSAMQVAAEIAQNAAGEKPIYCFPPIDLLRLSKSGALDGTEEMRENTRRLNEALASFKIEAHIVNVTRGPSVTRYEVELEKGVRLNKLTTVADDIALSLGASGVRIAAVPDKISVVGIEVPNRAVTTVSLREVIDSGEFAKAKSKSSFAVGKDIGGKCIVGNISKLPHMLIAGTTGSGKSVCMNSIIISLLYKASPDDVKLIMVDPKMVELGIYNGIPHLLIPVVTDPKKAAGSLQWAVTEMMRRYKSMSDAGVRDLESYNSIMEAEETPKLPQIVVIIDELADLMLVAAKEVEESICRIAQMGRAAGIHLIIATQRPSADVITGLMKANIPSRIAFSVASAMESRIILDTQGAEKLVGRGDMLFAPIGSGKPLRVQGCFVSDPEVEAVANYVKEHYITHYDQTVIEEIERKAVQTGSKSGAVDTEPTSDELDGDEMLPTAVDVILETGQASVSMLQRRLKLGYARAARIVDEMEEKGIVGPFQGSKPREILITKEQWEAMRSGQPEQMDFDDVPFDDDPQDS